MSQFKKRKKWINIGRGIAIILRSVPGLPVLHSKTLSQRAKKQNPIWYISFRHTKERNPIMAAVWLEQADSTAGEMC